jgi:Lrp/AsnC family transcriptional regulator for asnA, asnC and gidA
MSAEFGGPIEVDDLDLQIIGAMQVDGRRSIADVSREIGAPKSTIQRRLEALIRNRVIMVTTYVDSAKLGVPIHVHLNLRIDLAKYDLAVRQIVALTEVRWVAATTGPFDIVAEGFFASPDHLHEFIRGKLSQIPGVTSVETSVILKLEKFSFNWDEIRREADQHQLPHIPLAGSASQHCDSAPD